MPWLDRGADDRPSKERAPRGAPPSPPAPPGVMSANLGFRALHPLEHPRPALDGVLVPGRQADGELLIPRVAELSHALDELVGGARRGQVSEQRRGEEPLLLGARPDEVAAVKREIARVGRLVA